MSPTRSHIFIEAFRCNACGSCVEIAPHFFRMSELTEKAEIIDDEIEPDDDVLRAAAVCPVQCIEIDTKGA